jgi:hypothetical protein
VTSFFDSVYFFFKPFILYYLESLRIFLELLFEIRQFFIIYSNYHLLIRLFLDAICHLFFIFYNVYELFRGLHLFLMIASTLHYYYWFFFFYIIQIFNRSHHLIIIFPNWNFLFFKNVHKRNLFLILSNFLFHVCLII